jgi:hypothetical protein
MTGRRLFRIRRAGSLPTRFAGSIVVGGVLALLVTAGAAFLALQAVQVSQTAERMRVVAHRIATSLEQRVDLGLALAMLDDTQREIEREKVASAGIARIDVFGERGTRLFSTDRIAVGEPVPAAWLAEGRGPRGDAWRVGDGDGVAVGVPVVNSFNKPVGGVVVLVPAAKMTGEADLDRLWRLVWPGALMLVLCGGGALVVGRLLLGGPEAALDRAAVRLAAASERRPVRWDDGKAGSPVDAAGRRLTAVLDAVEAADKEIRRLDETT